MIETALVYIYSLREHDFIGCGALVEGGYIATCRHVWRDATEESAEANESPEVEIEFPFAQDGEPGHRATLADKCEGLDARVPDLVLLKPDHIPDGIMKLQLARETEFETGHGQCHCCLRTRNIDSYIDGEIKSRPNTKGMRQFTGDNGQSHWMEEGSSSSPIFLKEKVQQLAGIIALSEVVIEKGGTRQHEALIVPATTIHKYLRALFERKAAQKQAEKRGIDPEKLQTILAKLGKKNVPVAETAERLNEAVENILAQGNKPLPESNYGEDIEATLAESRAKLRAVDTLGALDVLQAKIAEEEAARMRRLVPLLKERAIVERLSFNYDGAKNSLGEVIRLAPDDVWAFIDLGDLYVTTGPLEEAANAFRAAELAARRQGGERDLSAALSRLGDVQKLQRELKAALKSFSESLAITKRLAKSDVQNSEWQRDLSISTEKIGDVQIVEGNLDGALKSYCKSLNIASRLAAVDRSNKRWQRDLSSSYDKVGNVQMRLGNFEAALKSYNDSLMIRQRLAKSEPADTDLQRELFVSFNKIGDVQKKQRDFGGALCSYQGGLQIAESLACSNPANNEWQHDLSVRQNRIGDVLLAQGDTNAAFASYRGSLDILDTLCSHDPSNTDWQDNLRGTLPTFWLRRAICPRR
jgi:tetratricopeptide (TPR) repeat protein